jgi:hypothetical protein
MITGQFEPGISKVIVEPTPDFTSKLPPIFLAMLYAISNLP